MDPDCLEDIGPQKYHIFFKIVVRYSFVDPYLLLVRQIDHCEGNKMFFVFLRWGKSRTAWRSTCPVWPPISSVAVSSKFIGLVCLLI
jgi:hypothetical protein